MAILGDTPFLERITFFNGQRLLAGDLQDLETFEREMRWLHNLSLHQPGIGSGFAVTGAKGDGQVTISPGYALDALGREIILTKPDVEQVPAIADNGAGQPALFDLVVAYPSDDDLAPSETRDGVCMPRGVVRLHEEPVFCWVRLSDDGLNPVDPRLKEAVRQQLMIVLGRVQVQNCKLKQDVSVAIRRNARPPRLPKVACGVSTVQKKDFKRDVFTDPAGDTIRLSTTVDTTSAGFSGIPHYYARLRMSDAQLLSSLMFGAVVQIAAETPTSFAVEIYRSRQVVINAARSVAIEMTPTVDVVWLGVEE